MEGTQSDDFAAFFDAAEPRLRHALTGAFGPETGREATTDALGWAWQHWDEVRLMVNPVGYLYRVGRSRALRYVRVGEGPVAGSPPDAAEWHQPPFEPALTEYLAALSEQQRVAVWLVHGLGFSQSEAAEILDCSKPTVGTHVRRALEKLRRHLGVDDV